MIDRGSIARMHLHGETRIDLIYKEIEEEERIRTNSVLNTV